MVNAHAGFFMASKFRINAPKFPMRYTFTLIEIPPYYMHDQLELSHNLLIFI